jgi:hypothetical protein
MWKILICPGNWNMSAKAETSFPEDSLAGLHDLENMPDRFSGQFQGFGSLVLQMSHPVSPT